MSKVKTLLALMLIAASGYSINGPDSCTTVLLGSDTFALCPIHLIKSANFIGVPAMEKQDLIEELKGQVNKVKFENSTLRIKNNGLQASLSTEVRVNDDLRKNKAKLALENNSQKIIISRQKTAIIVLSATALVQFIVLIAR